MTALAHIGPVPVEELLPLIALASSGGLVAVAGGHVRRLLKGRGPSVPGPPGTKASAGPPVSRIDLFQQHPRQSAGMTAFEPEVPVDCLRFPRIPETTKPPR